MPLYRVPAGLAARKPWYTRQQIDTLPEAQAALRGREIAWMADPIDAHDAAHPGLGAAAHHRARRPQRLVRLAFAGTNEQPYRSVSSWLLEPGR